MIRINAASFKEKSSNALTKQKFESRPKQEIPDPVTQPEREVESGDAIKNQETPGRSYVIVQQSKNRPIVIKKSPNLGQKEQEKAENTTAPLSPRPRNLRPKRPPLPIDGLPVREALIVRPPHHKPLTKPKPPRPAPPSSRPERSLHSNVPSSSPKPERPPLSKSLQRPPKPPRVFLNNEHFNETEEFHPDTHAFEESEPLYQEIDLFSQKPEFPDNDQVDLNREIFEDFQPIEIDPEFHSNSLLTKNRQELYTDSLLAAEMMGLTNEKPSFEMAGSHHPVPDFEEAIEEILQDEQVILFDTAVFKPRNGLQFVK